MLTISDVCLSIYILYILARCLILLHIVRMLLRNLFDFFVVLCNYYWWSTCNIDDNDDNALLLCSLSKIMYMYIWLLQRSYILCTVVSLSLSLSLCVCILSATVWLVLKILLNSPFFLQTHTLAVYLSSRVSFILLLSVLLWSIFYVAD